MAKKTEKKKSKEPEQPKITSDCPICEHILGACEKEGNREFCEQLVEMFKKKEITVNDFTEGLERKFGKNLQELMGT